VAEVLPVSSSAQLSLLPWLLRWDAPRDRTGFAAGLHAGSAVGIALALHEELRTTDVGALARATVPAAVAGLLAQDVVERRLGGPGRTAAALAGAGVLLWLADRSPGQRPVGPADTAAAGLAQVAALVPGVSRAGATVTVLRARGVDRDAALRHSLLLSLPVTVGAAGLTAWRARQAPALVPSVLAAAASWVTTRQVLPVSPALFPASAVYRLGVAAAVAVRLRSLPPQAKKEHR
jgi:undecaprenyl-diphosphatase